MIDSRQLLDLEGMQLLDFLKLDQASASPWLHGRNQVLIFTVHLFLERINEGRLELVVASVLAHAVGELV